MLIAFLADDKLAGEECGKAGGRVTAVHAQHIRRQHGAVGLVSYTHLGSKGEEGALKREGEVPPTK